MNILDKTCSPHSKIKDILFEKAMPRDVKNLTLSFVVLHQCINKDDMLLKMQASMLRIRRNSSQDRMTSQMLSYKDKQYDENGVKRLILHKIRFDAEVDTDTMAEFVKVEQYLSYVMLDKKIKQYDGVSNDLMSTYEESLQNKGSIIVQINKCKQEMKKEYFENNSSIKDCMITDAHGNDVITLIEKTEKAKSMEVKVTNDKRAVNRKCRDILNIFMTKMVYEKKSNAKQVKILDKNAHPTVKGDLYDPFTDEI